MKQPILVGIALAVLIVAAGLLAPTLRDSTSKSAEKARQQADLACRQLARVDLVLPRLNRLADTAAMKQTDFAPAVEDAAEQLGEISAKYAELVRHAEDLARREGLPAPVLPPLRVDAAGMEQTLAEFETGVKENEALLQAALRNANAAVQENRDAIGVAQVLGMAEYVRAAGLLAEAHELRRQQASTQVRLLGQGANWKLARGYADHFRGLDVAPTLAQLRTDLDEISTLREEAEARLETLSDQVAARKQVLAEAEQEMRAAREQLLAVEEQGFTAGDDQSFDAYRTRYLELTRKLQQLQEREQELRYGGRRGAELIGDDLATAEIQGGETMVGLEDLERRLATAEEKAKRLESANTSLEERIASLTKSGQDAQAEFQRYQTRLAELNTRQRAIVDQMDALNTQALEKEDQALQAVSAAVRAFAQSQAAAQAWVRAASELQSQKDPDRKNERLRTITQDPYLTQFAQSAEAAARVLAGRIHAQRVEANGRLIADMAVFSELNTDFQFDSGPAQTVLETARSAGLETLERARSIYEELSRGPANTSWAPLAALSAAYHLTARLDEAQAATYARQAAEYIQKAVEKREHSPYLADFLRFYEHMSGALTGGPAEPEEEEEEDFFGDEQ